MPQRQSSRGGPQLKTSSSDSDSLHHRPITDRSPKIGNHRSPRGAPPDSVNQKRLGTRIAGLESQLGQAQEELKSLKDQLASVEAAKKEAQQELEKKTTEPQESRTLPTETGESDKNDNITPLDDNQEEETDVFEVPVEEVMVKPKVEFSRQTNEDELETKLISNSTETQIILEREKTLLDDLAVKNDEINSLKAKVEEKEKELQVVGQENESLRGRLSEANLSISSGQAKERELSLRLSQLEEEVEASKGNVVELNEKIKAVKGAKEELESEMKKLRVQTEQWRKAADAAAAVLAGDVGMNNGRGVSERCGSMDNHFGSVFEGYVGSPGLGDDSDDGFGGGKRKGSGIRMFGELWKKKGQK